MSNDARRPCLLAVGALERDNFGDLLYPLLLEHVLAGAYDVSYGVPIEPQEPVALDERPASWSELMENRAFDALWTVGGEVGATPPEYAYLTRFGVDEHKALLDRGADEKEAALAAAMGGAVLDPPYIPRPSAFAKNATTPLVINSVGLSGIAHAASWRAPALRAAVMEATFVSVRDRASSAFLDEIAVAHRLAPDMAHIIARVRPRRRGEHGAALVHLSDHAFTTASPEEWAETVNDAVPSATPVRLFVAGLAPAHDSLHRLQAVQVSLRELGREARISDARGVWERTDEIAGASLWIGNSLHGRIVASAYGVPRVSLAKPKVDAYAADWDDAQPFAVKAADLASAVERALGSDPLPADHLADAAMENLRAAIDSLDPARAADPVDVLRRRLTASSAAGAAMSSVARHLVGENSALDRAAARADRAASQAARAAQGRITALEKAIASRDSELIAITQSRRWRLFERVDAIRGAVRRSRAGSDALPQTAHDGLGRANDAAQK
ncbi:polysaccharide pyruvyl transferase family protein [Microbacterium sp. CFBP9034]|uniref:polysaccharide pyruvyl transferase family protein n=1 Tax=Microbacterium sp. CFBP9034 TaxID=3096540 RepID=UPI002A69D5A4|nr:polysaccharide pyruvyl transferase family protein [Microbacterium sp. CFBP9034]MDY0909009.1 polysaccharide pyruvyl transferase family protein [Microbacterium sp. CFBP9034]